MTPGAGALSAALSSSDRRPGEQRFLPVPPQKFRVRTGNKRLLGEKNGRVLSRFEELKRSRGIDISATKLFLYQEMTSVFFSFDSVRVAEL